MNYKGFEYMGKTYVWHKKELYRLPYLSNMRSFGLLKCKKWNEGYILGSVRKSKNQLKAMNTDIFSSFVFNEGEHLPV